MPDEAVVEPPGEHSPKAPARHPWWILGVVLLGSFLGPLSGSIIGVALPSISSSFHIDLQTVKWVVLIYLLVSTSLLPLVGYFGSWIGEGRQYKLGFFIFLLATIACALAPNMGVQWLILFRAIQAVGSALMFGMGPALLTMYFPAERRSLAFGILGSTVALALISGPPLGVVLCDLLNWHWIFWAQVPIAAAGVIVGTILLPPDARHERPLIPVGSIAGWFALVTALVLLSEAFSKGLWINYWPLTAVVIVGALGLLIYSETRPLTLFNYTVLRYSAFWRGTIGAIIMYFTYSVLILLIPFYLEDYLALPTWEKGLIFASSPLATALFGPAAGHFADRIGFRLPVVAGMLAFIVSLPVMIWSLAAASVWAFCLAFGLMGMGSGLYTAPNYAGMMGSVTSRQRSVASSMSTLTRNIGFLLGLSLGSMLFGLLLAWLAGADMMHAARAEELASVVPLPVFKAAFERLLLVCLGLTVVALVFSFGYPNRVQIEEVETP
jgi:EmrB/QacA subfamily drug resistance transporter